VYLGYDGSIQIINRLFWTTKFRYKTNSELMDRFYAIDVNISKIIDYYERERGYK
jgi:hypothetical protein